MSNLNTQNSVQTVTQIDLLELQDVINHIQYAHENIEHIQSVFVTVERDNMTSKEVQNYINTAALALDAICNYVDDTNNGIAGWCAADNTTGQHQQAVEVPTQDVNNILLALQDIHGLLCSIYGVLDGLHMTQSNQLTHIRLATLALNTISCDLSGYKAVVKGWYGQPKVKREVING